jgi:hypothetical protein
MESWKCSSYTAIRKRLKWCGDRIRECIRLSQMEKYLLTDSSGFFAIRPATKHRCEEKSNNLTADALLTVSQKDSYALELRVAFALKNALAGHGFHVPEISFKVPLLGS